jgi:hypothetical protein
VSRRLRVVLVFALLGGATGVAALLLPRWRPTVAAVAALAAFAVGSVELLSFLGALRARKGSPFDRALRAAGAWPERPPDLERFERLLGWPSYGRREFDHLAAPLLRTLLRDRLLARRGIDLDLDPNRAREHLSPDVWAIAGLDSSPREPRGREPDEEVSAATVSRLLDRIQEL